MRFTNKFDLPETFVNVIHRPTYSKGDAHISVTELLNSPQIVGLKRKHWDEIEQDVSEMVWQLFGSAVHKVLEHGKGDNHVIEERLSVDFEGWRISGQIDLQEVTPEGIIISDYKVTSAWSAMAEKKDWHDQLNTYAWLVETVKKTPVIGARIVAIIRDWSAKETKEGYPKSPVHVINIPIVPSDEFVKQRIHLHNESYFCVATGEPLPECTTEEMWERPATYALMKPGNIRAKSVHLSLEEANENLTPPYVIEVRPGKRIRCESYCQVKKFCRQYENYQSTIAGSEGFEKMS